jgi:hypothetical protein
MSTRPRDWYAMTHEQRKLWEQQEREKEDAEYDRQEALDNAARLKASEARTRRDMQHLRAEYHEEVASLQELNRELEQELQETQGDVQEMKLFLEQKSLLNEFNVWREELNDKIVAETQPELPKPKKGKK